MAVIALPRNGHATSNPQIAAELRDIADQIERTERGELRNVVVVFERADEGSQLSRAVIGYPVDHARCTGLLLLAATRGDTL